MTIWNVSLQGDRHNPGFVICLLVFFFGSAGCASGDSAVSVGDGRADSDYRRQAELKYSDSGFITAWGIGSESEREAEQDARGRVAERISSKILSEVTSYAEAVMQEGSVHDYQQLTSQVSTISEFSHNELIEIDKTFVHRKNGLYHVFAHVSRRKLMGILSSEYSDLSVPFRSHCSRLDSFGTDIPVFASSFAKMSDAFSRMSVLACEIRAVSGNSYQPFAADRESMRAADKDRLDLLSKLNIAVKINETGDIDSGRIAESVRAALVSMGVGTVGSECFPGGWLLRLEPKITWKRVIGDICELTLTGDLRRCDGDLVITEVVLSDSKLRGSGRTPIEGLVRNITPHVMAPLLFSSLGHVVPFNPLIED